ncbi:MAG: AMP-binding protein, partial [Eudoraea sp.]|nr:AMP-binding protein [Eudoraea sp.]
MINTRILTLAGYIHEYQKSVLQPEQFWARVAESFHWRKHWTDVVKWNFKEPKVEWYIGGKLNITENILERHLYTHGDRAAIIWEPNDPQESAVEVTYRELYERVNEFANAMKANGVGKGDRVIIYMPMVVEAAVAMLACARIGAVHSVVFAGFSATSLADRINDCEAKMVLTSDENFRGKKVVP